jgi:hypothetical protein
MGARLIWLRSETRTGDLGAIETLRWSFRFFCTDSKSPEALDNLDHTQSLAEGLLVSWEDVFKLFGAAIVSIGGGGVVILALSSWLGKVWADRILRSETHQLATQLEATKRDLDVIKETTLRFQNDKILIYRAVIEMVARLLAALDSHEDGRLVATEAGARFDEFNEQRMKVYGYLAMLASQSVMDAQDSLIDHLMKISHGTVVYEWAEVREKALKMLNAIREDIGIGKDPITYNGDL